ncbi:maleylacetoacetate isomerase [Xylophilus sp.]|uniref:maleylacetoacetate isomerase n=1 Tax=Xylophilus sp. TaxID=2653893 RepID=UPI0013B69E93|nr:maleylacetoacetate isomerase [Xylophilus sp.]KAF1045420.1 MAG: Maleylpyruvate isomerase [Xylophilus sp.]
MTARLHTYFRSSAAYRVRIALHLKGLPYEAVPVHLLRGGGEQHLPAFAALNPHELVPVYQDGRGAVLRQSLAIVEYLDEVHPQPALLPADPVGRAQVRALALDVACEIHPVNNLRVLAYLTGTLGQPEEARLAWIRHWVGVGFDALEATLRNAPTRGRFSWGDTPTLADLCLVPQIFNARRFGVEIESRYPTLAAIDAACAALPAFRAAHPQAQPDAA